MKQIIVFSITLFAACLTAVPCFSDDRLHAYSFEKADKVSLFIGESTWQSTGDNEWDIAGTRSGGPPNILSELEYLGVESTVVEIYGGIREGRGALTVAYGFGSMSGGVYRDSDYLRDDRQGIYSLSTGSADGDDWNALYYWNIEYTYRLITNMTEERFDELYLDALIGYQKWREEITMTNGVQEVGGTLGPFSGLNSKYEFIWKSIRIGLDGGLPVYKGFSFKGSAIFIPYTEYEGKGIWNLRTDFKQNPSFTHNAKGGYGLQAEAAIAYYLYPAMDIKAGYRYWYIKSGDGDDVTYFSNGSVGITQLNEAVSERQGFFLDIRYIF